MFRKIEPRKIGRIAHLFIYPIKSCAPLEVESANLTMQGLETISSTHVKDREYMIVDERLEAGTNHHKFVTQRDRGAQKMALITTSINHGNLQVAWKGQDVVNVGDFTTGGELRVRIHSSLVTGVDMGDKIAKMLSDYLGRRVRLVRATGSFRRKANQNYIQNENTLCYQDAYSMNWLFLESVLELRGLLGGYLSFANFRTNMVAEDGSPNQEHLYYHLRLGKVEGIQPKPSTRCMIPNVDQRTGTLALDDALPLKTIFKNYNWIDKDGRRQAIFAENFLPSNEGVINVNDEVIALSEREPRIAYGHYLR